MKVFTLKKIIGALYWVIKGLALAIAMSFLYLVVWSIFIVGYQKGLTFNEVMGINTPNGLSKSFIDLFMFGLSVGMLAAMSLESYLTYKLDDIRTPNEVPPDCEKEFVRIKQINKKSLRLFLASYAHYALFMYMLLALSHTVPEFTSTISGFLIFIAIVIYSIVAAYRLNAKAFKYKKEVIGIKFKCLDKILDKNLEKILSQQSK